MRLLKRDELADDWDPADHARLTVWETVQHLIRTLETQGESGGRLDESLGGVAETARDLAYRLYTLCERKKWAEEALAYNGLVIAWPELTKLRRQRGRGRRGNKETCFRSRIRQNSAVGSRRILANSATRKKWL